LETIVTYYINTTSVYCYCLSIILCNCFSLYDRKSHTCK